MGARADHPPVTDAPPNIVDVRMHAPSARPPRTRCAAATGPRSSRPAGLLAAGPLAALETLAVEQLADRPDARPPRPRRRVRRARQRFPGARVVPDPRGVVDVVEPSRLWRARRRLRRAHARSGVAPPRAAERVVAVDPGGHATSATGACAPSPRPGRAPPPRLDRRHDGRRLLADAVGCRWPVPAGARHPARGLRPRARARLDRAAARASPQRVWLGHWRGGGADAVAVLDAGAATLRAWTRRSAAGASAA